MLKTYLDQDLRERPEDPALLEKLLQKSRSNIPYLRQVLTSEPNEENETRLGRELQRLGTYLHLSKDFASARDAKREAIAIWEKYGRHRAHFLARHQLAMIDIDDGAPEKTIAAIEALLLALDEKTSLYRDFLFEGLARAHFACGHFDLARNALEEALKLREARGNDRHIEETHRTLEIVTSRLP